MDQNRNDIEEDSESTWETVSGLIKPDDPIPSDHVTDDEPDSQSVEQESDEDDQALRFGGKDPFRIKDDDNLLATFLKEEDIPGFLPCDPSVDDYEPDHDIVDALSLFVDITKEFFDKWTAQIAELAHEVDIETAAIKKRRLTMTKEKDQHRNERQAQIHNKQDLLEKELEEKKEARQREHETLDQQLKEIDKKIHQREKMVKGVTTLTEAEIIFLKKNPHHAPEGISTRRPRFHPEVKKKKDNKFAPSLQHYHFHKHTIKHVHKHIYHDEELGKKNSQTDEHFVQNRGDVKVGHTGSWVPKKIKNEETGKMEDEKPIWMQYATEFFDRTKLSATKQHVELDEEVVDKYQRIIDPEAYY